MTEAFCCQSSDGEQPLYTLLICRDTGCQSAGAEAVQVALRDEIARLGLSGIRIKSTGCHGFCEKGPLVVVEPGGICYMCVTPADAPEIVASHLVRGEVVTRLVYQDPETGERIARYGEIPFYKHQYRIVLRRCGRIDPEDIDDFIASEGYQALRKALQEMTPRQVIEEVRRSGLRGRGGAGFSTGLKWHLARDAQGAPKYVVCNFDEGDPGAFMNRSEVEGDPHGLLEGMAIAAYAVGARRGYIYVRAEYPRAVHRLRVALAQAEKRGFLGENILGSGFSLDIQIKEGAGAFVCGEETALLASIEGRRGMPRPRPPYPAESGLWGKPTLINNVGTLFNIPPIILRGAEWFASIGTQQSKGTKVFSLVGAVAHSGLIEVPLGTPLRTIVYDIGGGPKEGRTLKAIQTGGPSGGCIPAGLLDLPVDYETLARVGSIVGSGGMVVMDETTCMVDVARFFLSFTQAESCGKCVPCRLGTKRMLEILERITRGEGQEEDIGLLLEVAETTRQGSLCGLGQTAPSPVLSTLRYFHHEYEAHIREKRCPALRCVALITYLIRPDKCQGCGRCRRACPSEAIRGEHGLIHVIDQAKCIKCGACLDACPDRFSAVAKVSGETLRVSDSPVPVGSNDW
ncbi:MAG: NADH-quinone oxidoreductase subunit NuoF [Chloroflexi bacterium]|nr:NADH-quinone oxidoreductase subunit NuoF [Chloroflexota bacterium]